MKPRSPTVEGFRAIFRRPSLGFAEIAWRWSFGAAMGLLAALACFEYLDTLPVTRGDLWLLRSRQPVLILHAVGNIVRGSGFRLVKSFIILFLALTMAWIVVAALARAATIRVLVAHFRGNQDSSLPSGRVDPLLGLNFLRAAISLAAVVGCFAGFTLAGMSSTPDEAGMALQIGMIVFVLVWAAWSVVNWLLSLAAIFVVAGGRDTFGAVTQAMDFFSRRSGPVFAVGTSFALAHGAAFVAANIAVAVPLGLAATLPGRVVLAMVILITLIYFAVADFLYIGRLAAYVAILETPEEPSFQPSAFSIQPSRGVDPSELILSDLPGL